MARADTASASLRSDSIQGLAKSIAKPAYRRLLSAEPLLRRAVPVLIIAFLITVCIGAVVQVLEQRRQVIGDARQVIEALADDLAIGSDHPAKDAKANFGRASAALEHALPAWAAAGDRSILVADCRRHDRRQRAERSAEARPPNPRRARAVAAADHVRRRRRHAGDHAAGRRRRAGHGAGVAQSARHPRRRRDRIERACQLAIDHRAHRYIVGNHRLRGADPRLCLSLAGDARARGRSHPRHRARPHRHRAQSRPLRVVGLGSCARPRVLVPLDVRHARPAGEGRTAHLRRIERAGA